MAFDPDPFMPAWWCRGPHAQTLWAAALRPAGAVPVRRERWETPDGDFLDVDRLDGVVGSPAVVILHGLEGSSAGSRIRGLLVAAHRLGWRALALNFRSCSGEPNRLPRSYHAGDTEDLGWLMDRVAREERRRPVACIGVSLGGNVLVKYLGERPDGIPEALKAAVAISTPFDLGASARAFERGLLNRLYLRRLVRSLKGKTLAKLRQYPDLVDRTRLAAVRTLAEFDDLVTAPVHGFTGARHYWSSASCAPFLPSIRRPLLLINALDDPVVPAGTLPRAMIARHRFVTAAFTRAGGHAGFIGGSSPAHPLFWAERTAMAFCERQLQGGGLGSQ